MQYRKLGRTGIEVSEIGFGGWGIGGDWGDTDDAQAVAALERAFELGINFYDTARVYGDGHSEELIGRTFKGLRDRVVIATKIPPKTNRWPVVEQDDILETFPGDWVVECTEASLRSLGTDYIDVQQLHAWTPMYQEVDEWYDALERLREQGKIRAFGVSTNDWDPYGAEGLVSSGRIHSLQVIYNIFEQRPSESLLPEARGNGTGIIVRVPFEEGLLTGELKPGHEFEQSDWRSEWLTEDRLEEAAKRVDALRQYLGPDRPTLAALALKFCLSNPAVSTVIPGMRSPRHVEADAAASDGVPLPQDVVDALKRHAFVHGWAYPWSESDLVTVAEFMFDPMQAEMARGRLQSQGIETFMQDNLAARMTPIPTSPILIQVRRADAERAIEILSQPPEPTTEDEPSGEGSEA